jgi:hypothetical protein
VNTPSPFPASVLSTTSYWANFFASEWQQDFPDRIHDAATGADGSPRWHADFAAWLFGSPSDDQRRRTTQAFRKLRRISPRAYEVAYRVMILGNDFSEVTRWLNERARGHAIPLPAGLDVHYRLKDAVALFIIAIDYVRVHW